MLNRSYVLSVLAASAALALTGCKKEPTEPAPIQDGQFLKYRFDNRDAFSEGTITFNKDGSVRMVKIEQSSGYSEVDAGIEAALSEEPPLTPPGCPIHSPII